MKFFVLKWYDNKNNVKSGGISYGYQDRRSKQREEFY